MERRKEEKEKGEVKRISFLAFLCVMSTIIMMRWGDVKALLKWSAIIMDLCMEMEVIQRVVFQIIDSLGSPCCEKGAWMVKFTVCKPFSLHQLLGHFLILVYEGHIIFGSIPLGGELDGSSSSWNAPKKGSAHAGTNNGMLTIMSHTQNGSEVCRSLPV